MSKRMSNKKVKQMIIDTLNSHDHYDKSFCYHWDETLCLICFKTCNFIWTNFGVVSLTADQLRALK